MTGTSNQRLRRKLYVEPLLVFTSLIAMIAPAFAGGGLILRDDVCVITIGFYEAHFTAYQPDTRGSEEFCRDFPDTGETLFVLDYLHSGLKRVPVDFRILKDTTGLGQFVRWEDVEKMQDIEGATVFYQPPAIEPGGSYRVQYDFSEAGDYIGIVTAGHPTNDKTYNSVFAFSVGKPNYPFWLLYMLVAALFVYLFRYAYVSMANSDD
jgi:hypothetical protein